MVDLTPLPLATLNPADFKVGNEADEVRVDELAVRLLLTVRDELLAGGFPPLDAGRLCRGADLFLRDFIIPVCGDNLLRLPAGRVRQFAGHWYIVNTLDPQPEELAEILAGIAACYRFLNSRGLVAAEIFAEVTAACADLPWYKQRIADFWAIEGDGYRQWRDACPLPA